MSKTLCISDIRRFERCPYAYRLDETEANKGVSPQEFLDNSVRSAIAALNRKRLYGHRIDKDTALAAFWNAWDIETDLRPMYPENEKKDMLKIGEKCMANYVKLVSSFGNTDIIACDLRGEQAVPGGSVEIRIDEISKRGDTLVISRYLSEPGIRSKTELEDDAEMFLAAQWARYNIPGADRCIIQWRMLHPGLDIESDLPTYKIDSVVKGLGRQVSTIKVCNDFKQREGQHCTQCQYRSICPRFTHEQSTDQSGKMLVTQYAEFQEKIDALKQRIELLETQQEEIGAKLIDYADSHGYTALTDGSHKVTISHIKKAELPKEKGEIIRRLTETGKLQEMSTVNYSRLRADIVKGIADRRIAEMAVLLDVDRILLKKLR